MRKQAPSDSSQVVAHAANAATLLALARDVFGHAPEAWLLTIPVADVGLGEDLSPLAHSGFDQAVQEVGNWADKTCSP